MMVIVTMIIYCPLALMLHSGTESVGKFADARIHFLSCLLSVIGELEKPLNESPSNAAH